MVIIFKYCTYALTHNGNFSLFEFLLRWNATEQSHRESVYDAAAMPAAPISFSATQHAFRFANVRGNVPGSRSSLAGSSRNDARRGGDHGNKVGVETGGWLVGSLRKWEMRSGRRRARARKIKGVALSCRLIARNVWHWLKKQKKLKVHI